MTSNITGDKWARLTDLIAD